MVGWKFTTYSSRRPDLPSPSPSSRNHLVTCASPRCLNKSSPEPKHEYGASLCSLWATRLSTLPCLRSLSLSKVSVIEKGRK
jgi:hypothetical protein